MWVVPNQTFSAGQSRQRVPTAEPRGETENKKKRAGVFVPPGLGHSGMVDKRLAAETTDNHKDSAAYVETILQYSTSPKANWMPSSM